MKQFTRCTGTMLAAVLGTAAFASTDQRMQDVRLQFAGELAGQAADCSRRHENVGLTGASVGLADFRFYVSRVRMLDEQGNETVVRLVDHGPWQHGDVALLDFENGSANCSNGTAPTNHLVLGEVPVGDYTGIAFDIGVPFDSNHADPTLAASPLNLTALFWNWRGGYRFMRVDLVSEQQTPRMASGHGSGEDTTADVRPQAQAGKMKPHGAGAGAGMTHQAHGVSAWALHVGSTGCIGDSPAQPAERCTAPNRISVRFAEADIDNRVFVVDPAAVLESSDVTRNTEGTSPGCMSSADDPECAPIWQALGLAEPGSAQSLVTLR